MTGFQGRDISLKEGFSELAGKWTDLESRYSETEPENMIDFYF